MTLRDPAQTDAARKVLLEYGPAADARAGTCRWHADCGPHRGGGQGAPIVRHPAEHHCARMESTRLASPRLSCSARARDRIAVQVPGVQDASEVVRLLGKVATLEFRLVDPVNSPLEAARTGRAPLGTKLFKQRDGSPVLLKRDVIATGEQLIDASFAPTQGEPSVSVRLDSRGGDEMLADDAREPEQADGGRLHREGARTRPARRAGSCGRTGRRRKSSASRRSAASSRTTSRSQAFRRREGTELAKLLRAGASAAPIIIVEQRVIGPASARTTSRPALARWRSPASSCSCS